MREFKVLLIIGPGDFYFLNDLLIPYIKKEHDFCKIDDFEKYVDIFLPKTRNDTRPIAIKIVRDCSLAYKELICHKDKILQTVPQRHFDLFILLTESDCFTLGIDYLIYKHEEIFNPSIIAKEGGINT